MNNYRIAQLQFKLIEAALTSEIKEYTEDWRDTPILRQGGRFASRVSQGIDAGQERAEQVAHSAMVSVNKRIDIIKDSLVKLNQNAHEKLIKIFSSTPMNRARKEIGKTLEKVSPESKQVFDEINQAIDLEIKKNKPLDQALSKGQKQSMKSLRKALDSMKGAAKEHQAGLLAMGACAALTAVTGGAGLLIGAGAVGAVANWSVPNLLGNAVEFATTKQLLKDDKNLLAVWEVELNAEISQFLFRASLVVAGIGVLVLAEEVAFHALEKDKKTFAQGIKVATQDAISGITDNPSLAATQEDLSQLGEFYKESRDKRLATAQKLTEQVSDRAEEFITEKTEQVKDAASQAAQQAIKEAQQSAKDSINKAGEKMKEDALSLIPGRTERQRQEKEKEQKRQEAAENEAYKQIAGDLIKKVSQNNNSSSRSASTEELERIHLQYEQLAEERRIEHEKVREHLKTLAEERERRLKKYQNP